MANHRFTYVARKLGEREFAFHKFKMRFKDGGDEPETGPDGAPFYDRATEDAFTVKRGVCNCPGYTKREQETRNGTCKHVEMARKLEAEEGEVLTQQGARVAVAPITKAFSPSVLWDEPAFVLDERGNVRSAKLTHNVAQLGDMRLTIGGLKVAIRRRG